MKILGITSLTGMLPGETPRNIRLQHVAKMMIRERVMVSEAAFIAGLNDLSYFSKRFKKQSDMRPKKYQKKYARSKVI